MSELGFFAAVRQAVPTAKPQQQAPAAYVPAATFAGEIKPYAAEALNREVMNVAAAPSGTRNDTLNIAAVKLGSLVAGGHLPPDLVLTELTNAATAAGLEPTEIRKTLNSGLRKGEQTPREIPDTNKEVDQWLNTVAAAPAHRAGSANGSTPGQAPLTGVPTPQNGTQPLTNSTSGTSSPWEQPATAAADSAAPWTTAAPSSSSSTTTPPELPWQKNPASTNGQHESNGQTDPQESATVSAAAALAAHLQPPPEILNRETAMELLRLQSKAAALRMFNQSHTAAQAPPVHSLTQFLQQEDEPVEYRVHGLLPAGGRIVLAAQYKAGKSSMVGNLVKSLADGKAFLDSFYVDPAAAITVVDDELSEGQLRRWFREQEIQNTDAVHIVPLRGALSTFDILDPVTRKEWARRLQGTEVLILDCLRPVMDALGLSEDKDAGKFLVAFDALIAECGAREAVVVHHMGHGGNRSRGDSRILDWPDATWSIKREDPEDPNSPRYFEALGRDVKVSESLLEWNPDTRGLRIAGGGRAERKTADVLNAVVEFVKLNPHVSGRGLQMGLKGNASQNRQALNAAVEQGLLRKYPAQRGGYSYTVAEPLHEPPRPSATDRDRDQAIFDRDQTP